MAFPGWLGRDLRNDGDDHFFGGVGVAVEVCQDHFQGHMLVFLPTVVIGGHGHGGVGDLRLAGALGLAQIGHADDIVAGAVVGQGFGARAEGGAFHAHVGAAIMCGGAGGLGRLQNELPQFLAHRFGKGNMRHNAAPEKSVIGGLFGAIKKLVNDDDVARLIFFLERPHGAHADDPLYAEFFHAPDVGAMI